MASPLFDEYDPYGAERVRALSTGDRRYTLADLLPEEEKQGMLSDLAARGGSGLGAIGWLLDTPGAVVRGLLSGGESGTIGGGLYQAAQALVPGQERISGRDLARRYGLVGDDDTWANFIGGIGAEIALDPLTYATLGMSQILGRGVLTPSGQFAKRRGLWKHLDAAAAKAGVGPREFARTKSVSELWGLVPDAAFGGKGGRDKAFSELLQIAKSEAAKKLGAGATQEAIGEAASNLLGGKLAKSHGWSIPGVGSGAIDLFGKSAGDIMARGADRFFGGVSRLPVINRLPALFDAGLLGMTNPARWSDARRLASERAASVPPKLQPTVSALQDFMRGVNELREAGQLKVGDVTIDPQSPLYRSAMSAALSDNLYWMRAMPGQERELAALKAFFGADQDSIVRALQVAGLPEEEAMDLAARQAATAGGLFAPLKKYHDAYLKEAVERAASEGMDLREFQTRSGIGRFTPARKQYMANRMVANFLTPEAAKDIALQRIGASAEAEAFQKLGRTATRDEIDEFIDQAAEREAQRIMEEMRAEVPAARQARMRGEGVAQVRDMSTKGREPYLDIPAREVVLDRMTTDRELGESLRAASNDQVQDIMDKWFRDKFPGLAAQSEAMHRQPGLFGWAKAEAAKAKDPLVADAYVKSLYSDLADTVRFTDPQNVQYGISLFGTDPLSMLASYAKNRATAEVDARFLSDLIARSSIAEPASAAPGGLRYSIAEAAKILGYDTEKFADAFGQAFERQRIPLPAGLPEETIADRLSRMSVPKSLIDDWARRSAPGRVAEAESPLWKAFQEYTKVFKTLALLFPSRYARDRYSGAFAAASKGLYDREARNVASAIRSGDYGPLRKLLEREGVKLPGYESLSPDERVRKFLSEMGSFGLSTSTESDALSSILDIQNTMAPFPGAFPLRDVTTGRRPKGILGNLRTVRWEDLADKEKLLPPAIPGTSEGLASRMSRSSAWRGNPLVEYGNQFAEYTDARNRFGTYIKARLDGYAPTEAKRLTDLTQVNYSPEAFTDFERDRLRWLFPFYSYTRGIMPLVFENALSPPAARPISESLGRGGVMDIAAAPSVALGVNPQNVAMRILNRASEPREGAMKPEHLRQSAAIPVPGGFPFVGLPEDSKYARYLTNIDLPFEPVNLLSVGVGNSPGEVILDTIRRTGMNIAGQMNPIPKSIIESLTNRQLYSGRQLSDLYSMIEQAGVPGGRSIEQVITSLVPGGSRVLGSIRQLSDARLSAPEALMKYGFNALTGLRFTDVDEERTRDLAARTILDKLLSDRPEVRTFTNIDVRDEDLARMPPAAKRQYLLYKVLQSEAAKRARERKKKEQAMSILTGK